jgi:hypothetical protein
VNMMDAIHKERAYKTEYVVETGNLGHNRKKELDKCVEDALLGLQMVKQGEADTIAGWIAYGAALNEGRELFPGNLEFGQWKHSNGICDNRCQECKPLDQVGPTQPLHQDVQAAMWAAEDPDRLYRILEENPKVTTVRGAHAKWKKDNLKKVPKGVVPTDPNLRLPTEEEAKRIKNLKDRAASTGSEPEKQAVQSKLEKLKESGVDVNSVMDQAGEDREREQYFAEKQQRDVVARRIADYLYQTGDVDTIKSLVLNVFPSIEELQKAESIYINGEN